MKVLYLTNLPIPYRVSFFQELGRLCELTVLFERKTASDRNKMWFDENSRKNFRCIVLPGIRWGKDSAFNPSVIKWLKDRSYDIVVVSGYSSPTEILAILYMKLKKIPFVMSTDGGFPSKKEPVLKKNFKKFLVQAAGHWLASGAAAQKYLEYYGADPERIYHYPFTSLEKEDIQNEATGEDKKEAMKHLLGISGLVVLSVGRFIPLKGFDVLLKAWRQVKDDNASLVIIGGGPQKQKYSEMIRKLKLKNIKILDFMKKDMLKLWYRAADIFVHPTRYDSWGLVINEAMAQSLPVITTDRALAGMELVREGKNGFIVPADDADTLAQHIELLLSSKELRERMARHSNEIIKPYTIVNMAHAYLKAFEKIISAEKVKVK